MTSMFLTPADGWCCVCVD